MPRQNATKTLNQKITTAAAEALFTELRDSLLNAEEALQRIVETEAWQPLGYKTFIEAWADRMQGVKLTGIQQAIVVYAMIDAGTPPNKIAASVTGVGPEKAAAYQRAHDARMDVGQAERHAAAIGRAKRPSTPAAPRNTIRMEGFTSEQLAAWQAAALESDMAWPEWCKQVFTAAADKATGRTA